MGEGSGAPLPAREADGGLIEYRPMNYCMVGTKHMAPGNHGQASQSQNVVSRVLLGNLFSITLKNKAKASGFPGAFLKSLLPV